MINQARTVQGIIIKPSLLALPLLNGYLWTQLCNVVIFRVPSARIILKEYCKERREGLVFTQLLSGVRYFSSAKFVPYN